MSLEIQSTGSADEQRIASRIALEQRHRSGSGWFYWIAGLSLIASIIQWGGGSWGFMAGLGVTQFADAVALAAGKDGGSVASVFKALVLIFDLMAAGSFFALGWLARKGHRWAYITGMVLYVIDALVLLLLQAFLPVAFHGWALFGIWGGFQALKKLGALPTAMPAPETEPAV